MNKHLLLIAALLIAAPAVHAQKANRLRGQALVDSLTAARKAHHEKFMANLQHGIDSTKAARESAKSALDDKNGFRTYHFGDDISKYSSFVKREQDGDTKYYTQPNENLKIGDATLKSISYGFYKGKLYNIFIQTSGVLDSRKVLDALTAQYGAGYQSNKYIERYYWFGNVVILSYDENSITKAANIIFSSKAISEQKEEDKKLAAKKAASDL